MIKKQTKYELATEADYDELLQVWEASVRSSHHFLTEEDIQYYKPLIRNEYFRAVELYLIRDEQSGHIAAFMGLSDELVEMLFVHPSQQGKGYGRLFIEYALRGKNIRKVDVNEQNEQASHFYLSRGFEVVSRDATDGQGKPYPILHLQMKPIRIRKADAEDLATLHQVFEKSVRNTCCKDYSPEQIDAWINRADSARWQELFHSELHFFLAEDTETFQTAGFTSVDTQGYLHSMFVHPRFQKKGIATLLLRTAEMFACHHQAPSLFAEVSLTARPFFERQGFVVEKQQTVTVSHVDMTNFAMRKQLP